ncbi:SIMPL domain-containing protein [Veillonella criceti]|uniref:26 kDa periplasmic immunogenic protein n=1 Tax=Veillonella criceti TaxID=103891 RepID=A0A380NGD2_9FIRM|nr:SIMPL domain-containing protein [Veillonella criceti]SUP40049.1 26 kDa periplasmic immunogenic protein precursor [Veillonella criceti]
MKLQFKKTVTRGLLIAALAAGFTGSALAASPADTGSQIHVSGTATRSVAPNYALLRLGITSEASTVAAAKTTNDRVMSDLISRLTNLGISKNLIQTSNFSVSPRNEYRPTNSGEQKEKITSYVISNTVTVRINDLNKISQAIDNAVAAGANNIQSLSFQADVDQSLTDQLTAEAVKNGRHQAEVIASALGQQLGSIKDASVGSTNTYTMENTSLRMYKMADAALSTSTPVEQGDITVSKDVDLTFYVY